MPGKSKFQISRSLDERIKRIISGSSDHDLEYADISSAYILGFNYGNVTNCVGLTTNYQLHHAVFPVVGLAYFKTSPNDDEILANLKAIREYSSSPNGLGSFKSDKNEHLFLIYSVEKNSKQVEKRIFNFTKGTFVRRKRLRLSVLNDPFTPRQIYNGSDDIFNLDDVDSLASAEDDHIDHLIFFVHGVGGVCDARFRSCVEVVADFKKMANGLLENHSNPSSGASTPTNRHLAKHLRKGFFRKQSQESSASRTSDITDTSRSSPSRNRSRRVECLPVSWHSLTRRQTGINDQLQLIALSSVPKLRNFIDKVVLDALLYTSGPCYTQTIINNVGNEINRLYTLFMEKHPNFEGSVSLVGHSLGSVILFDLLAHQTCLSTEPVVREPTSPLSTASNNHNDNNDADYSINNNFSNNNNNDDRHGCSNTFNSRKNCLNISHHHHNISSSDSNRYCSDYTSLEELLKDMNLIEYASLFHKEHIDLNSLLLLTDIDLKELQLPLGARRKLGTYINFKRIPCLSINCNSSSSNPSNESNINNNNTQNHQQQTNQSIESMVSSNPMCNMNTGQYLVEYPQLKFKPRCFFAFGSPAPMFLNIRGIQNISSEYKLPTCDRMLNIYHPYDPLAYRMEPLIDPRFKSVEPVLVPHHRGGKRIHVQLREGFAKVGHDIKHRIFGSLRNTWSSFTRVHAPDVSSTSSAASQHSINDLGNSSSDGLDIRRKRSMKSASSSVELEIKSIDSHCGGTCTSKLQPSSTHNDLKDTKKTSIKGADSGASSSSLTMSKNSQRNQLKRQQEFRRSHSETTNKTGSDLSSILESSYHNAQEYLSGNDSVNGPGTESSDPENPIILGRLKSFKLESTATTNRLSDDKRHKERSKKDVGHRRTSIEEGNFADIDDDYHEDDDEREDVHQRQSSESGSKADGSFNPNNVGRLNCGRRIDHVLQEKPIELFNEYIFVATSHANYWQHEDSALLVLKEIYQVDNIQIFDHSD